MNIDATVLLQVLGAIGGLAGIGAIINVFFSRKKISAEANSVAQDATTKVIQNLTGENQRLQKQIDDGERDLQKIRNQIRELSERIAVYDLEMSNLRVLTMGHVNWSRRAYELLVEANKELTDNGINIQYKIEAPPDSSALMAKFAYIESRIKE